MRQVNTLRLPSRSLLFYLPDDINDASITVTNNAHDFVGKFDGFWVTADFQSALMQRLNTQYRQACSH
jgi:hypothetical protein